MSRLRLSNKGKFILVGVGFLAIAGIAMLILALCLHWDIGSFFVHPVTVICYVLIGGGLVSLASYLVVKKIREG